MQEVTQPVQAEGSGGPECTPIVESRRPPCPVCQAPMEPEHAHHRCPSCGYIEPCCGW
ncbi:MAG TPA: 50S ribosomal protein L4 [Actinomycetota bacterium]